MIKIETNKGELKEFKIEGDLAQITAETSCIIREIYTSIKKQDDDLAKEYKHLIITYIDRAFMSAEDLLIDSLKALKNIVSVDD